MSISAGTPGGVTARRRRCSIWNGQKRWPVCSDCEKTSMLKTLRPLWPYLWRYRSAFLLGLSALALKDPAAVSAPMIIRGAVDRFPQGAPAAQIWRFAAYLVGVAILRGIFQYWMRVVLIGISRDIEYDLRNDLFRHLVSLSADFYARNRTGDIMARATNDLNAVRMMLGPGVMCRTETTLTFVLAIAVMASSDWRLTLLAVLPAPLVSLAVLFFGRKIHDRFERIPALFSHISSRVATTLSALPILRADLPDYDDPAPSH